MAICRSWAALRRMPPLPYENSRTALPWLFGNSALMSVRNCIHDRCGLTA